MPVGFGDEMQIDDELAEGRSGMIMDRSGSARRGRKTVLSPP